MKQDIESKALEKNMEITAGEIVVSDEHLWFISLSESYFGINKRAKEFFTEYHHSYSNRQIITEQLSSLVIGDFWLYQKHPERIRAFEVILGIFDHLMADEKVSEESVKIVIYTLLGFIDNLSDQSEPDYALILKGIEILDTHFEARYFSYVSNLGALIKNLNKAGKFSDTCEAALKLAKKVANKNIEFWEQTTRIEQWYQANQSKIKKEIEPKLYKIGAPYFAKQYKQLEAVKNWKELVDSTYTFNSIASDFRKFTEEFEKATEKFNYLFYLLHLPGMAFQRDHLLWDLNKLIQTISHELNHEQIVSSIDELFILFGEFRQRYVAMVLDSVLTLGKEIINSNNLELIHYFEEKLINLGFVSPGLTYQTNEWQLKVDRNHIKNIRVWLELIEYEPEMMKKLLSALIINLRLGGIFIFDTDLFQRDVTRLLNSRISVIYKQIKQLTRIFPVYFNEIGAEGELRDVSTVIDELSQRNDKLIHFLRKQIHTEGNNSHIEITKDIIRFWKDPDTKILRNVVPENVISTIDVDGIWVKGVHEVINALCSASELVLDELLEKESKELEELASELNHTSEQDKKRVLLIIKLYQLLKEKYSFESADITNVLEHYRFFESEDIKNLDTYLSEDRHEEALKQIYAFMVKLNQIIFDAKISQGWENIYYKRHVAFGIPSMYGRYHEDKFEALGVTFRLESVGKLLMERMTEEVNTYYITAKTLKEIYTVLKLMHDGLELDGITDQGFSSNLKMLQYSLSSGSFSVKQYINIFQFMEGNIKEIRNRYFIRPYEGLLKIIIPQLFHAEMPTDPDQRKAFVLKKSELFYRDLLYNTFLVQQFDNFIGIVLNTLQKMATGFSLEEIHSIMSYDPGMAISPIYKDTPAMDNQVFLGSKAYFLKKLYRNEFPVPPGFVLTTEIFRRKETIIKHSSLKEELDSLILRYLREIEKLSGKEYGNPHNPLLLSVRSGSAISMPGAMNTFLNVGMNDEFTDELSKQHNYGWTSWDCYRRLIQTWGMSYGLDRNDFDQIMLDYKQEHDVAQKIDFPGKVMREMTFSYKKLLTDNGIHFEPDPLLQLKQAILSVFNSWDTQRSNAYRNYMHIADEWGTAVIVQQMVFGNIHRESGSGVLFTQDPNDITQGIHLTGDFSFLSQGEDIVAGLVNTLPISEEQREKYYQKAPFSLETAYPKIYNKLGEIARELTEQHDFRHQEMEFTFETAEPEDLYILQTRDISIVRHEKRNVFDIPLYKMKRIGSGIGIGNEVLNGLLAFDMDDLMYIKENFNGMHSILVRPDTVPDDIEMIFECNGLLTGKGGATSHAAVTAATLGKIGIVNCIDLVVNEKEKKCSINEHCFKPFDRIAIDGINGIIYKGHYPIKEV